MRHINSKNKFVNDNKTTTLLTYWCWAYCT